jgi:predicted enzyme related to lactoylglutathione lyase
MGRVVHFEIHAGDPDRAERFYTDVFGWTVTRWGGPVDYRLVTTGPDDKPGINGAIIRRQGERAVDGQAVIGYVCTIDVADLGQTEKAVLVAGGQQVLERMAVPGIGWLAYFKDPEGNILGAMQSDPTAAPEPGTVLG